MLGAKPRSQGCPQQGCPKRLRFVTSYSILHFNFHKFPPPSCSRSDCRSRVLTSMIFLPNFWLLYSIRVMPILISVLPPQVHPLSRLDATRSSDFITPDPGFGPPDPVSEFYPAATGTTSPFCKRSRGHQTHMRLINTFTAAPCCVPKVLRY